MQKSVTIQKHLKIFPICFKDYTFAAWRCNRILFKREQYSTRVGRSGMFPIYNVIMFSVLGRWCFRVTIHMLSKFCTQFVIKNVIDLKNSNLKELCLHKNKYLSTKKLNIVETRKQAIKSLIGESF